MESLAAVGMKFVERCAVKTAAVAADDFLATIKRFGFAAAACGVWAGVGRNLRSRFFFVSWPADWLEFYEKNRFSHHDPLLIEARRRISSFWFSEVLPGVKLTAKQEELLVAAATYARGVGALPFVRGLWLVRSRTRTAQPTRDRVHPMGSSRQIRCRHSRAHRHQAAHGSLPY